MERAGVATAAAASFTDLDAALEHLRRLDLAPVVKADGLAAGKGVVVPETAEEAEAAVRELLDRGSGGRIVLEERLRGREVSAFALVSDEHVVPLGAACDYKRLADGDAGPNTGGMGAYSPVPWFDDAAISRVAAEVFEPVAWRMARDGYPYRGVLYAGLMITSNGPMVLEFNARFGDPEAQVLLPMLAGEPSRALLGAAVADRGLMEDAVAQRPGAAVGVVIASDGYPDAPRTGREVRGIDPAAATDDGPILVFHAGTRRSTGEWETTGGRVATVVGLGADLAEARDAAYRAVDAVELEGAQHRGDVAERELVGA
jgi:phosphoribosylamine---glycine ligase